MDTIFINSSLINPEDARNAGAFTTLPIRLHKRNDLADQASRKVLADWGRYVGDGQDTRSYTSISRLGNLGAFTWPEVQPERLGVLTYLLDLGLLHDDSTEASDLEEALAQHRAFEVSLDTHDLRKPTEGSRGAKLKNLVAEVLLEAIQIDRELGLYMLEKYQEEWLAIVEKPDDKDFKSLEEYFEYRKCNFGMRAFWPMVEYGMAYKLSQDDWKLVRHVIDPIEEALMLTNDYWSWERELRDSERNGNRLVNSVHIVRQTQQVPIDAARTIVKDLMVRCENLFVTRRDQLFRDHPQMPLCLKRFVEGAGCVISGSHYWASSCDRHHAESRTQRVDSPQGRIDQQDLFQASASSDGSLAQKSRDTLSSDAEEKMSVTTSTENTSMEGVSMENPANSEVFRSKGKSITTASQGSIDLDWRKPSDAALLRPYSYINSLPSKGVRSSLIEALNIWFQVPDSKVKAIKGIVNQLHNASLMLDDIEDNSPLRRGKTAAHIVFGESQTINSANFLFVQAIQEASNLNSQVAVNALLHDLECLFLGQSWDLYWKHNLICPTKEQYMNMVDNKTGGMFRMLTNLLHAESHSPSIFDLNRLNVLLGRFFQVRDDYMNLEDQEYANQKGFCEDLDERKFSFPIVCCIEEHPEFQDVIIGLFRQDAVGSPMLYESKLYVVEEMRKYGALSRTRQLLEELETQLQEEIYGLERVIGTPNHLLKLLLTRLSMKTADKQEASTS